MPAFVIADCSAVDDFLLLAASMATQTFTYETAQVADADTNLRRFHGTEGESDAAVLRIVQREERHRHNDYAIALGAFGDRVGIEAEGQVQR